MVGNAGGVAPVRTVAEVQRFEQACFAVGVEPLELMECAGVALQRALRRHWPGVLQRSTIGILCGPGNNGGDGFVLARRLRAAGNVVRVYATASGQALDAPGRRAECAWRAAGGETRSLDALDADWPRVGVWVDCLFGIGLSRPLGGAADVPKDGAANATPATSSDTVRERRRRERDVLLAHIIQRVNDDPAPVLAADIPSGLDADTGRLPQSADGVPGQAIRATVTVTFLAVKPGLLTARAAEYAGTVVFEGLGQQLRLREQERDSGQGAEADRERIEWHRAEQVPGPMRRPVDAHKGVAGRVLVVGGANGMSGAVRLAGEAALRAGAGRVRLLGETPLDASVAVRPELMTATWEDAPADDFSPDHVSSDEGNAAMSGEGREDSAIIRVWERLQRDADVVVLGPGLGRHAYGRRVFRAWWAHQLQTSLPTVLDADGLHALAALTDPAAPEPAASVPKSGTDPRRRWILTPHSGEAAFMLGVPVATVEGDRYAAVRRLARTFAAVVVLKGAGTLVAVPSGAVWVVTGGHCGMASAGTGDALAGIIAACWAQALRGGERVSDEAIALRAVAWHARAALRAIGAEIGARQEGPGMLAGDLIEQLPATRHGGDASARGCA